MHGKYVTRGELLELSASVAQCHSRKKLAAKLNANGIASYADLAGLSDGDLESLGKKIAFGNPVTLASWRAKAKELA